MMKKRLAIIGSGDLGQLIAWHAETDGQYAVAGFFDDYKQKGTYVKAYPVLGGTNDVEEVYAEKAFDHLMIAIGYKHMSHRENFFERFSAHIPFGKVVHSSAYIDASCQIGAGVFILPGCILDQNVTLGNNVVLNTGCCIAHDSTILHHSFLSPRVAIAGFTVVGNRCNIGINTTIIDNIILADDVQTGAATVVIKNIEKAGLYVGNPARFIR